ncbi:MAG TPA: pantoate--beta-alanine ligase [Cyclobacteriaceae bacterium]|nr:pantoate--beta-alanine ligase [Cyclobacteriaceae bacterium]
MQIFKEIDALKAYLQDKKKAGFSVGLVPTMGALHEGHLALVKASKAATGITVCSLFVNPTQFNNPKDLEKYPRTVEKDIAMLEAANCDVLFAPETATMYERPGIIRFDFGNLDKVLEGKFRPGHFSGVATVVVKLFNVVEPDQAFFGQKDYQQFQIISRLVEELKFNIKLNSVPIVREASGLAMSSRNTRLTEDQRKKAIILHESLLDARTKLLAGKPWLEVQSDVMERLNKTQELQPEYFELAHRDNLSDLNDVDPSRGIMLIACVVGPVRLIDNMLV